MAGHHHRAGHMRRVQPQVSDQGLGETFDGEFGRAVGGVRHARPQAGPEAVDAADVDDAAAGPRHQQRQERPGAEVDATPADVEAALPSFTLVALAGDKAAAAADAGVVEQQVDVRAVVRRQHFGLEGQHVGLDADIDAGGVYAGAGRRIGQAQRAGFGQTGFGHIAQRQVHPDSAELLRQRAADAAAAAGDDGNLVGLDVHGGVDRFSCSPEAAKRQSPTVRAAGRVGCSADRPKPGR